MMEGQSTIRVAMENWFAQHHFPHNRSSSFQTKVDGNTEPHTLKSFQVLCLSSEMAQTNSS